LSERGPRAGKQLPQRPTIAAEKLEDEDKKTTDKKVCTFYSFFMLISFRHCTNMWSR
jgi:hypothetical protein